ncbi:MAG: GNAT family N-acetyltransferase [Bacteroidota bacterium]|nr:GNAT family N-acetyltransferase [Bacteroidota bacterium]
MENINDNRPAGEYRLERLDVNRLKDLAVLYKAVYGNKRSKEYFRAKYDTAYTGIEFIGYIAYSRDDKPAAFYGMIPCFIQYKNEIILCAQATDAMTHPGHRYKGLFVKLAAMTFDLCKASGVKFIFGFPNQNSFHGLFDKLHWQIKEVMDCFTIPVSTIPVESRLQRFKWTKWVYKYYTKWILHKYFLSQQGLSNAGIQPGYAGVLRDNRYLEYKTYGASQLIRIRQSEIWIKINNGLHIGDINMTGNKDDFDRVISTIVKIAKRLGVAKIIFQTSPGTHLHDLFSERYKPVPSFPVIFLNPGTELPLDKLKFTLADIDIF